MHHKTLKVYMLKIKSNIGQQTFFHVFSILRERYYSNIQVSVGTPQKQYAFLLIAFVLLQYVDLRMCCHISANHLTQNSDDANYLINAAHSTGGKTNSIAATEKRVISNTSKGDIEDSQIANNKRRIGSGQPEEIFSLDDRVEASYDEYPMVVPKRAALLLDRLMVALHHALEKERRKISDFYAEQNDKNANMKGDINPNNDDDYEQINGNHMYSDDDPSVVMDYDFKDLNSINRATGETLMAKSFQRRGSNNLDLGGNLGNVEDVAMLTGAAARDDDSGDLNGIIGRNGMGNTGRIYWRCYFNAVSCF
ncbi:PREDICTED: uncharacterized protein LOC108968177 isoform X1 [Bactrocera latifrons]|uniref:uncharacterized protein LOC108968177 isoform X1 n=1 Tax=Bactrocera latifrons TaxID=174628 RepID=UPI0008DCC9A1|nr:PREDICTED: uncharacterized protein LOC108968177 isoform X1 [Bactrocera latifrons]